MAEQFEFNFGDKLPWICEVIHAILDQAPGGHADGPGETDTRKACKRACILFLHTLWCKSFGTDRVISTVALRKRIVSHIKNYEKFKKRKENASLNARARKLKWTKENEVLFDLLVGDPSTLDADELAFYNGMKQKPRCNYSLSTEVDEQWVQEQEEKKKVEEEIIEKELQDEAEQAMIWDYIDSDNNDVSDYEDEMNCSMPGKSDDQLDNSMISVCSDLLNSSICSMTTRSGFVLKQQSDAETQTEYQYTARPQLRSKSHKVGSQRIKTTLAKCSTAAEISVAKARICFKIIAEEFYKHNYYLKPEDVPIPDDDASGRESCV